MALLLSCARTRIDEPTAVRIYELAGGEIDWSKLRALSHRHRVMPLLYRSLFSTCPERVPEDVLDRLRLEYQRNTARNMELTSMLLKILDRFEDEGIAVIPFKGPILAVVIYGDQSLRLAGDLDLLVRIKDVPAAHALLEPEGFQPEYRLDGFGQNEYLQGPGACHFTGSNTNIDLHWEIAPRMFTYDFDSDGYWSRLDPVTIDGKELRVLSMGDRLLMLCGHGVRNAWSQLVWICDVAETIPHISQAEWHQVYERSRSLGSEDILHFGLSLSHDLIDATLPVGIHDQTQSDSNIEFLVHKVSTRLLLETDTSLSGPEWLRFQLRVRHRFLDKVRFFWCLATTANVDDLARRQLHSHLSFMYLFHRAVRLMSKYVLRPLVPQSRET